MLSRFDLLYQDEQTGLVNYILGPVYSVSDRLCIENVLQETAVVLVAGPSHIPTEAGLEDDDFEVPKKRNISRSRKKVKKQDNINVTFKIFSIMV